MSEAAEVHRRLVELSDAGRHEEALALIDPDAVDHRGGTSGDHVGVDAWREKWARMNEGIADASVTIEQNVTSGDCSVNRYTVRGTQTETGRSYAVTGIDMIRVRGGRLVEHWAVLDVTAMRAQLSAR